MKRPSAHPAFEPIETSPIKAGFEKFSSLKPLGFEKNPPKFLEEIPGNMDHLKAVKFIAELKGYDHHCSLPPFLSVLLPSAFASNRAPF
jgi:hypothetical protein